MKHTDVLIVGGGPAGSSAAWALKDSSLHVTILDKQSFPRQKVCAGWVTPAVLQTLAVDPDEYARDHVLQPISGFRISLIGQNPVQSYFPGEPVSYGIRRFEFDHYLLQRCAADLMLDQSLKTMQRTAKGWRVNEAIEAEIVIGAGGHFCPVARATGAKSTGELAVAAQEIEFKMTPEQKASCNIGREVPELFFTPDLKGYGWIFRKGDYLNIGLGREDKSRLSSHVQAFCEYLRDSNRISFDLTEKFAGHAYILYPHALRRVYDDNVLLVGDSAGLAYPQSGEGIRPAVESGLLAAETVLSCQRDYSSSKLHSYHQNLEKRFGRRQPGADFIERLPQQLKQKIVPLLMKTQWFTKKIVTEKWFLQAHQKPLH